MGTFGLGRPWFASVLHGYTFAMGCQPIPRLGIHALAWAGGPALAPIEYPKTFASPSEQATLHG